MCAHTDTHGDGHGKTEAEIEVTPPQAKKHLGAPDAKHVSDKASVIPAPSQSSFPS